MSTSSRGMYCWSGVPGARITSARVESAMISPSSRTITRFGLGSIVICGLTTGPLAMAMGPPESSLPPGASPTRAASGAPGRRRGAEHPHVVAAEQLPGLGRAEALPEQEVGHRGQVRVVVPHLVHAALHVGADAHVIHPGRIDHPRDAAH